MVRSGMKDDNARKLSHAVAVSPIRAPERVEEAKCKVWRYPEAVAQSPRKPACGAGMARPVLAGEDGSHSRPRLGRPLTPMAKRYSPKTPFPRDSPLAVSLNGGTVGPSPSHLRGE